MSQAQGSYARAIIVIKVVRQRKHWPPSTGSIESKHDTTPSQINQNVNAKKNFINTIVGPTSAHTSKRNHITTCNQTRERHNAKRTIEVACCYHSTARKEPRIIIPSKGSPLQVQKQCCSKTSSAVIAARDRGPAEEHTRREHTSPALNDDDSKRQWVPLTRSIEKSMPQSTATWKQRQRQKE